MMVVPAEPAQQVRPDVPAEETKRTDATPLLDVNPLMAKKFIEA